MLPVVALYFTVIMFMYFIAYQTMERQLEELGNRWIAVCKWIDDQWLHLQVCRLYKLIVYKELGPLCLWNTTYLSY